MLVGGDGGTTYTILSREEKIKRHMVQDPIIALIDHILYQAVIIKASDIHLQPHEGGVIVRYRIDGILHNQEAISGQQSPLVISRLKILSMLDIAEHRVPQDGKFKAMVFKPHNGSLKPSVIDFRIATFPSIFGEKVVVRILDRSENVIDLEKLGFGPTMLAALYDLLSKPHGLFLVTGPTGAGKTTTLYAMLNKLNSTQDHIITMEDPVEYDLEGITQSQINLKAGFSFETGLRALLRQDPDIIMLGEIRDKITARIAIESALTGHLVLSTLHTNDAPGAITRLIEMGVESYLINASLSGVLAQRLLRRLCQECKKEVTLSPGQQKILTSKGYALTKTYQPQGCSSCFNIGYSGRVGIFEFLTVDDAFRDVIIQGQTSEKIREIALQQGLTTLMQDGIKKVEQGEISLEELFAAAL